MLAEKDQEKLVLHAVFLVQPVSLDEMIAFLEAV